MADIVRYGYGYWQVNHYRDRWTQNYGAGIRSVLDTVSFGSNVVYLDGHTERKTVSQLDQSFQNACGAETYWS